MSKLKNHVRLTQGGLICCACFTCVTRIRTTKTCGNKCDGDCKENCSNFRTESCQDVDIKATKNNYMCECRTCLNWDDCQNCVGEDIGCNNCDTPMLGCKSYIKRR